MHLTLLPFSSRRRPISPLIQTIAFLQSLHILSFIVWPIIPALLSHSTLLILYPLPFILPSLHTLIHPLPISSVPLPLSIIRVTTCMQELALSLSMIVFPTTCVDCPVWPLHCSLAIPEATSPFPWIDCTTAGIEVLFSDPWLHWIIRFLCAQCFPKLTCSEVFDLALSFTKK